MSFLLLLLLTLGSTSAWHTSPRIRPQSRLAATNTDSILECSTDDLAENDRLKRQLFQLGASYDRGFGASPRARDQVESILQQLEELNPESDPARGVDGSSTLSDDGTASNYAPLAGKWRMIWTTAPDVLGLQSSPLFVTGAIYQVFEPPIVTNIIDFLPRPQTWIPGLLPESVLRAQVLTRANRRNDQPNRVGLVFKKVELRPLQVLGQTIDVFPPLQFDLPKLPFVDYEGDSSPGYFDVTYLDSEVLIIRQNAPGGIFVLLKVDSIDA